MTDLINATATSKLAPKTKRKLKPGMGKSKGSGFEGQVAKKLTAALAPLTFIRSPGSGARLGGKNYETFSKMFGADAMKLFVADVVATNDKESGLDFLHSIECKSYKTPDNFTSLASGTANVFKWFEESVEDAKKTDKNPLLIFKWNNTAIFVAVNLNHSKCLVKPNCSAALGFSYASNGEHLAKGLSIYYFDELVKDSSFWYSTRV